MDNLITTIEKSDWADRTKKNRIAFLKSLKKNIDPDSNNFNFLKNFNVVSKYVLESSKNPTTLKNKILTVKSILKIANEKSADKYDKLANSLIEKSDEARGNNIIDEDKWISYDEMKNIPNLIADDIKFVYDKIFLSYDEIDNLKTISAKFKYFRMLTDYIIAVLYCLQPPVRADYGIMLLKPGKDSNWLDTNRLVVNFQDFKNVKKMGPISWTLIEPVKSNLKQYISILNYIIDNPKYLLYMIGAKTFKPFTRETFAVFVARLLHKYTNKKISLNTLRHVYETAVVNSDDYNKLSINQKKELHSKLLHSAATGSDYQKVDNPIELKDFKIGK